MRSKYSETSHEMEIYRFLKHITTVLTKYPSLHWTHQNAALRHCPRVASVLPPHTCAPWKARTWCGSRRFPTLPRGAQGGSLPLNAGFSKHIVRILSVLGGYRVTWEPSRMTTLNCQWKKFVTTNKNHYNIKQVQTHFPSKEVLC